MPLPSLSFLPIYTTPPAASITSHHPPPLHRRPLPRQVPAEIAVKSYYETILSTTSPRMCPGKPKAHPMVLSHPRRPLPLSSHLSLLPPFSPFLISLPISASQHLFLLSPLLFSFPVLSFLLFAYLFLLFPIFNSFSPLLSLIIFYHFSFYLHLPILVSNLFTFPSQFLNPICFVSLFSLLCYPATFCSLLY